MSSKERDLSTYYELDSEIKRLEKEKAVLRNKILQRITENMADHNLPVLSIEIPHSFVDATGMDILDFMESRYPGWDLQEQREDDHGYTLFLKKSPEYMTAITVADDIALSKMVAEYVPEIDWETLEAELPQLYDKLVVYETTKVLNDAALEKETEENPEIMAILRRHMKVRKPSPKISVKKVQDDEK